LIPNASVAIVVGQFFFRFLNVPFKWQELGMKFLALPAASVVLASLSCGVAKAKFDRSRFIKARVLDLCERACQPGGNKAVCCTCNGGAWYGRMCHYP
jgi:hypothetical protein